MRLLILADIHANIDALEAVARDAGKADAIYCAGDYVDYGTDPHEVITWLQEHQVHCVIGNHDTWLLERGEQLKGTWVYDNYCRMTPEDFAFLRSLPENISFSADGYDYVMHHQMTGNTYDMPKSVVQFDACWESWFRGEVSGIQRRIILGHTHRRCIHQLDENRLWLNPGSVSYRRPEDDTDKRAHYMMIEDGSISFRTVAFDRSKIFRRIKDFDGVESEKLKMLSFFSEAQNG